MDLLPSSQFMAHGKNDASNNKRSLLMRGGSGGGGSPRTKTGLGKHLSFRQRHRGGSGGTGGTSSPLSSKNTDAASVSFGKQMTTNQDHAMVPTTIAATTTATTQSEETQEGHTATQNNKISKECSETPSSATKARRNECSENKAHAEEVDNKENNTSWLSLSPASNAFGMTALI